MPRSAVTKSSVNDIKALQRDFERSQRTARRSPRTTAPTREAIDQLAVFLERSGMPTSVPAIRREHVGAFMDDLNARTKPSTASNRSRALQQFYKFAEEEEINRSPMERMQRPTVPMEPVPVLSTEDLSGQGPEGPGVPFGKPGLALGRYLRVWSAHHSARGTACGSGRRGAQQAGIGKIHPDQFRHTFAHTWLSQVGNEGDLVRLTGWSSRNMLARYAALLLGADISVVVQAEGTLGTRTVVDGAA